MPYTMITSSLVVLLATVLATPAAAQSRTERPYRGVFGSGSTDPEQSLRVSGTLGGVYDSDLVAEVLGSTSARPGSAGGRRSGGLGQFSGSAIYALSKERVDLSATASSSGRYYPSEGGRVLRTHNIGGKAAAELGLGLSFEGSAGYQPFSTRSMYEAFFVSQPGEPTTDFDFGSSLEHFAAYSAGLGWGHRLSRRTNVSVNSRYRGRVATAEVPPHRAYEVGGGLRYNIGRGVDVKLGYGYTEARYAAVEPVVRHIIDAGVDYSRALSFSRRTTLSFSTGTAATDNPTDAGGLRVRVIGNALLNHEIGRTWHLSAGYNRNLRLDESWTEPIFADAVTVTLAGLINRRVQVHARAGSSRGQTSLGDDRKFETYFGDTGVNFGIGRYIGIGSSYRYHQHSLAEALSLAAGIAPSLNRHSVQAYVSLWAPIFERARRP